MKLFGNGECSLATENDQRFDLENIKVSERFTDRQFRKNGLPVHDLNKAAAISSA